MANANFFSPDGGITRYPLEDTEGRIMHEDDIDGINQVKIFHPSQTINGITFTVSNGKIIASGTATDTAIFWCSLIDDHYNISAGNYHASGCPEQPSGSTQYHIGYLCTRNGSDGVYGNETGNGLDFEVLDGDVNLRVGIAIYSGYAIQGTLVFEPMLTEAKYAGIPYRPYNQQSIQHQINDITGVTGVGNFFQVTAQTQTVNGVTFTINSDKIVTITGIATGYASINNIFPLKPNQYILNGLEGSVNMLYEITRLIKNGTTVSGFSTIEISTQGDYYLDLSSYDFDSIEIRIKRFTNGAVSGTIKPKLRLASDPSDEYVPYAMTNRELTDEVITQKAIATANQLWSSQLSTIYSVFSTLTGKQKRRAKLYIGGDTYNISNIDGGMFGAVTCAFIDNTPNVIYKAIRLNQGLSYRCYATSTGNVIYDDSATTNTVSIILMA